MRDFGGGVAVDDRPAPVPFRVTRMVSRRSLLTSFLLLAAPGVARADTLLYRFGRWYRIPDPDGFEDEEGLGETRGRIRRPPSRSPDEAGSTEDGDAWSTDPRVGGRRVEDPRIRERPAETEPTGGGRAREEAVARRSRSPIPPTVVRFSGYAPGTLVISTAERRLHLVLDDGASALRYGVGVGREGFSWKGTETISAKREWPDWTPPADMRARDPKLPAHMDGGLDNPLGARALYLGDTLYRIHGTNQPSSIGRSVSSGCIRMANADVIDLYERVAVGTPVVVL